MKAISLLAILFVSQVNASGYPPDYPLKSDCQDLGQTVRVCRNLGNDWASMTVQYRGKLLENRSRGALALWIKLNGKVGTFRFNAEPSSTYYQSLTLSQSRHSCNADPQTGIFKCEAPTPEMKDLLFWARPNSPGIHSNAWDIELAFFIEGTQLWDNNGSNYRGRFDQVNN